MNNFVEHITHQPVLGIVLVLSFLVVLYVLPYFLNQKKIYGSYFDFATTSKKRTGGFSFLLFVCLGIYMMTPYVSPPSEQIALIVGNTQNTPAPKISSDLSDEIEKTLLQHKGKDTDVLAGSIKIISAVKQPEVAELDIHGLRKIGNNTSNAKRSAKLNLKVIEKQVQNMQPTNHGANYVEAILTARDNVDEGSKIIVIGSGLSDSGDLNFSKNNLLTSEEARNNALNKIKEKYGRDYLEGYSVVFHGLGDTTEPQQPLSNKQKTIVRNTYAEMVRRLGGTVETKTQTLVGAAVDTKYDVGETDTGCGNIGLIFDDDNLKFVSDQALFTDPSSAKSSLSSVKTIWDKYSGTIQSIQVDGYIAHYAGPDSLSQQRADLVKQSLVSLGVPASKITAAGKGFGPYEIDAQNRIVKVNIDRDSDQCSN